MDGGNGVGEDDGGSVDRDTIDSPEDAGDEKHRLAKQGEALGIASAQGSHYLRR